MRAGRLVIGALILILGGNARSAAQDASRIIGVYRLIEDKPSGFRPSEGSEITLSVEGDGKMNITALQPGNALTTQGTYAIRGNLISLDFPEFGKSVRLQPWSLDKQELRLPMQFIGDGAGTSRWRRIEPGDGPMALFFITYNAEMGKGRSGEAAVKRAAEEARRRSVERKNKDASKAAIDDYDIIGDGDACTFTFENGHREIAVLSVFPGNGVEARHQTARPLTRDPRTHIPARPKTAPDDPPNKTAVLFAPLNSTAYYSYVIRPGKDAVPDAAFGWTASFKERGEDLELFESKLRSCRYQVTTLRNEAATPLAFYSACVLDAESAPGLIYIGSHCVADDRMSVFVASGVCLAEAEREDFVHDDDARFRLTVAATVPPGYHGDVEGDFWMAHHVVPLWFQKTRGVPISFLGMTESFFRRMSEEDGVDFSDAFVYANGCQTAKNRGLIEAFQARQFLGNKDKAFARSVFNEARYVFALMAKPTFCVRETAGLMRHIVKYRESIFYPEDGWLAEVEEYDNNLLALFGEDGRECELPDFDVLYLCWMARWNSNDPESGCRALQNAYNDFWSKGRFSRLKSPFANAGVRGTHVPTEEEVRFARHLVCGDVRMPGGRFTLNDAEPVRQKTGK